MKNVRGRKGKTQSSGAKRSKTPKGQGKRDQNKERTREKILQAALGLFSKQGFEKTTTKQVSTKAGIAEGTLFNYFQTKEDLALFFFQNSTHDLIKWFRSQA